MRSHQPLRRSDAVVWSSGLRQIKQPRRSITISYLHPSSSLHQRPKASVTSDAALITTCPCLDCLRGALSTPPTPPPTPTISRIPPFAPDFPHPRLCSGGVCAEVQSLLAAHAACFAHERAHKGDVTRHMRRSLAGPLYLHIAARAAGGASRLCLTRAET